MFQIILSIALASIICVILTITDAIPDDPQHWAYLTRIDTNTKVLSDAKWFRFPYPGKQQINMIKKTKHVIVVQMLVQGENVYHDISKKLILL